MNRRPITAHILVAVLLLTALWPLGSSAGVAEQASAAPPASGQAKAAVRPSAPAASAPAAASAMPASFQGRWRTDGRALETGGPLTLGVRTLRWPACGKATRRIKPQVTDGGQHVLIDLTADGAPPCHLNGQPVTHLRLKHGSLLRPGDVCDIQVTLYQNGSQPAQELGWGEFTSRQSLLEIGAALAETCPQMRLK